MRAFQNFAMSICAASLFAPYGASAQTPPVTSFMDTFKQIAAVDLREIDHVADIAKAKSSTALAMIDQDGKQILGWVDVSLVPPSEMFKKSGFKYTVAIQGAQYRIADTAMREAIAIMTFKDFSSVGCIDGDKLEKYFNQQSARSYAFHDTGYDAIYDVNKGEGFITRVSANFTKGEPCVVTLSLIETNRK